MVRSQAKAKTSPLNWKSLAALTTCAGLIASAQSLAAQDENITVSHGYNFFGELKYPADYTHPNYVNPEAPKGGEISLWGQGTFDSFNLYTRKGRAGALSTIGHEDILLTFADDPTASYCRLCETLEYPQDLSWVIYNLRPEVQFTDGTYWTAEDLKFTFDLFMEQGLPSFRAAFGTFVKEVEVLGPHKIKFVFNEDSPERDRIPLSGIFSAFSKKWFEDTGARLDESTLTPFMGTGAYELDSYDINQRIIYKRRDDYWAKDLPFAQGRENFDFIRIEYFADSAAAFEAFKAGEYTFRNETTSKTWATGYNFPAIENGWAVKAELPNGNLAQAQSYVFNLRREKFQDRRVREALGLMFNFEWSNESLFFGIYERVQGFWGNSDLEATGLPTEGEKTLLQPLVDQGLLDASILTNEVQMSPVSGTRPLDRNALRKASALLDDAGWLVGDDGMRRKDGVVLSVEILESSPSFDRVHNPYIDNLKRLGVDAKLNRVDPAQATDRERNYDFDMTVHSLTQSREPSTGLQQWFGSKAADQSTRNLMGLKDPAVDALIDVVVNAKTKDELRTGVKALDRVLRAELFWVPQWFKDVYTVSYYDQYEFPEPLPETALGELDFWWFNPEKNKALVDAGALNR